MWLWFCSLHFDHAWFCFCMPIVRCRMNRDSSSNPTVHGLMWGENHLNHYAFGMIVAFCNWESTFKWFQTGHFCGNHGLPKIRHNKLRHQPTLKVSTHGHLWFFVWFLLKKWASFCFIFLLKIVAKLLLSSSKKMLGLFAWMNLEESGWICERVNSVFQLQTVIFSCCQPNGAVMFLHLFVWSGEL